MKDLPDGTFPGILRELMVLDFPIVVKAEVTIPDQTKMMDQLQGADAADAGRADRLAGWLHDERGSAGRPDSVP